MGGWSKKKMVERVGMDGHKIIKMIGLITVLSYMLVILATWIYSNLNGYIYFSAGEPNIYIKYTEWLLGMVGIISLSITIRDMINE